MKNLHFKFRKLKSQIRYNLIMNNLVNREDSKVLITIHLNFQEIYLTKVILKTL